MALKHKIIKTFKYALAAMIATISTASFAGEWVADVSSGCKVWDAYPQANDQVTWSGNCVNGFAEGRGIASWASNGVLYERDEGRYSAGKPLNVLKVTNPNGHEAYVRVLASGEEMIPREIFELFKRADAGDVLAQKTVENLYSNGQHDVKVKVKLPPQQ